MKAIRKQIRAYFDIAIILSDLALLFVLFGAICPIPTRTPDFDLYFSSYKAMAKYGSNYQTIYRVEFPFGKPKES